ncbi:MAG TPA: hypothetical protein VJ020_04145, partial [Anaerolineales bacterium]|nr:hypothetical protein [Anaerolineales bacterium]
MSAQEFGRLLSEGIRHISLREGKPIGVVEDELGYAIGREGNSAIQYWRKGHCPSRPAEVETLATQLVRRGELNRVWVERFLHNADYPDADALCARLFPNQPAFG